MKHVRCLVVLLLVACVGSAHATLGPNDVVLVVNNDTTVVDSATQATLADVSRAVARYYCYKHSIPYSQIAEITADPAEAIYAERLARYFLADTASPQSLVNLLKHRPGFDINDPASDPTRCIVLCYGVPLKYGYREVFGSVDSMLTMLFSDNSWGGLPLGTYAYLEHGWEGSLDNPFCASPNLSWPVVDDNKLFDFGDFRASPYNSAVEAAPYFTKVRFLSADRAIAAGKRGMIFVGQLVNGDWQWSPVADENKGLVRGDIVDLRTVGSGMAVATTEMGSVMATDDNGQTWTLVRSGSIDWPQWGARDLLRSASLYWSGSDWRGYAVGKLLGSTRVVLRYDGVWTNAATLPSQPNAVAALDAGHAWVSAMDGIYFTSNGGSSWEKVYSAPQGCYGIWAGQSGTSVTVWAVNGDGTMVKYDGSAWTVATGVAVPIAATADLSVYDADHLTVAWGGTSYLQYDAAGSPQWTMTSTDHVVASASWTGSANTFAASGDDAVLRVGTPTGGSCQWAVARTVGDCAWRMRYLVCRLDGYSSPLVDVPGYGLIPADIKNMIDRSVNASYGEAASAGLNFVLDGDNRYVGRPYWDLSVPHADRLSDMVGEIHVWEDPEALPPAPNRYLNYGGYHTGSVVGYASHGSYSHNVDEFTEWYRPPDISWVDGAVGMYWGVSGDAYRLRTPKMLGHASTPATTPHQPARLRVYLSGVGSSSVSYYSHLQLRLYADFGTQRQQLGDVAYFTDWVDTAQGPMRAATVTIPATPWPNNANQAHFEISFPDTAYEAYHPSEFICRHPDYTTTTDIWNAVTQGNDITYAVVHEQSLESELIRLGCSGTIGNAWEPTGDNCALPGAVFTQYAGGCTWAESAWSGIPRVAWMQVVIGDPLMHPFALHPLSAPTFVGPTPATGMQVAGPVRLSAQADAAATKMAFWACRDNKRIWIGDDDAAPFECLWDTLATSGGNRLYPDGSYTLQAVSYQSGVQLGRAEVYSGTISVNSSLPAVAITSPSADNSDIRYSDPIIAQASSEGSTLQVWLLGAGTPLLLGEGPAPSVRCTIPLTLPVGSYVVQAVAHGGGTSPYESYSAQRTINLGHGVGDLSLLPDDSTVTTVPVQVVAKCPSTDSVQGFYIEDRNRAGGILVASEEPVEVGDTVVVSGTLHTGDGITSERYIEAGQVSNSGPGGNVPPLFMDTRTLFNEAPDYGNPGSMQLVGAYNVGLLATICGRVTLVSGDYICVDDGANPQDALPSTPQVTGIPVYLGAGITPPGVGSFVRATGVICLRTIGSGKYKCLLARDGSDIVEVDTGEQRSSSLAPVEVESLARAESEPMPAQAGPIDIALSQPDGMSVNLAAVQVCSVVDGFFGAKQISEAISGTPRLSVARTGQVGQSWIVDVQGTITTLGNGQRAIVPASVWLYTDANGRPAPPWAWMVGSSWPHKQQIQ